MNDLVSIILPYYKKKKFIKKTLDSIFLQTYKNYEIILIYNDKDKSDLIYVRSLLTKFKNYKLIINTNFQSAGFSRNLGIQKSLGNFIAFLDCDDFWSKYKLAKQINYMKSANIQISHTSYFIVDENNLRKSIRIAKILKYFDLIKSCDIGLSTIVIRKSIFKKNIKFPEIKTKEDYVLWLKLAKKGHIFYSISEPLTYWRKTINSLSSDIVQKLKDGFRVYYVYEKYSFVKSIYNLLRLSINFILKKIK
jgi:teichuronic acid biosynthesis glycosyltransferase TuaG